MKRRNHPPVSLANRGAGPAMINPSSKYLSERLIFRLSRQRRANLQRRIREHLTGVVALQKAPSFEPLRDYEVRLERMLGRLSALTA